MGVAAALVDSTLPGGRPLPRSRLPELLARRSSRLSGASAADRRLVQAGSLMAHVRLGRLPGVGRLVEELSQTWPDPRDGTLPVEVLLALQAAVVEAYVALGESHHALAWAERMSEYAEESTDPRWAYRSLAVSAAARALNGDWARATLATERGHALLTGQGWDEEHDHLMALAEALLAFTALDREALGDVVSALARSPATEPVAALGRAGLLAMAGNLDEAVPAARTAREALAPPYPTPLLREAAALVQAFVSLREGVPLHALAAVRRRRAVGDHLICPHAVRAAAHVQLGEYRRVLVETANCVAEPSTHSPWLLPLIAVSRAIAHLRLGHEAMAVRSLMFAGEYCNDPHFTAYLWVLPSDGLLDLLRLSQGRSPWQIEDPERCRGRIRTFAIAPQTPCFAELSPRERVVASALRLDLPLTEIARRLRVSPGTVSAQASAVYRKLGVSNREEAVRRLEEDGFY